METVIKECKKHGMYQHNVDKDGYARCSKCASEAVQKRRDKVKMLSVEYKGGKCSICGYDKYIGALEFHHLDSNEKDFGISEKGYTRAWEIVKEELDKCILVCANCHRELHQDLRFQKIEWSLEDEENSSKIKEYFCTTCNKNYMKNLTQVYVMNVIRKLQEKLKGPLKKNYLN